MGTKTDSQRRPRDAAATRQALLTAARALIAERGYERTTLRQVAEGAGVDAALVARYFGGKEGLYHEVMATEPTNIPLEDRDPAEFARALFDRWAEFGPGPMVQALLQPGLDPSIREPTLARVEERMIGPMSRHITADREQLRAEILLAALVGVGVVRNGSALPALSAVPQEELLELLAPMIAAVAEPPA